MKPYLYILVVLSVGGVIGFFAGRETLVTPPQVDTPAKTTQADSESIHRILERQVEAYRLRDSFLLMRDCEKSFVEIDGNSGRSYDLAEALVYYHQLFQPEKGIRLSTQPARGEHYPQLGDSSIPLPQDFGQVRRSGR